MLVVLCALTLGLGLVGIRIGPASAGRSTRLPLKSAAVSILIDLAAALLATSVWIVGGAVT